MRNSQHSSQDSSQDSSRHSPQDNNRQDTSRSEDGSLGGSHASRAAGQAAPGQTDAETTTTLRESLSALMDGESDQFGLRRILRELPADPELAATWRRYHAVRASLQREIHSRPAVDLLAGVNAGIEAAGIPQPQRNASRMSAIIARIGQGAIAASVAVAVMVAVGTFSPDGGVGSEGAANLTADAGTQMPTLGGAFNAGELARAVTHDVDMEARNRLEQAVLRELEAREVPVSYNPAFP